MSVEQDPSKFEPRVSALKTNTSEIILAEGVPSPITLTPSFENTQVLFSALSFPIDGKNPTKPFGYKPKAQQTSDEWARDWEILGRYLGTEAVGEEIRDHHEISRERVRQIVERLIDQSYNAAPAALKQSFPRESLATRKPYSLHKAMRVSEMRGGKMRMVQDAVLAGKSNTEIQEEIAASGSTLRRYRARGIAVPYLKDTQGKEYQENLYFLANGLLDDRQILTLFDDIGEYNRHGVCYGLRKAGVLVSLGKAARSEGAFIHLRESAAYRLLKGLGIPVLRLEHPFTDKNGEQKTRNYFFVLNNHERTTEAFAHPSFDAFRTNPVEVLGRVPDEIPTTNIMWDDAYISTGKFLKEVGIPIRPEEVIKYLDSDCPVSVFCISTGGNLLVRKKDFRALADYLNTKLASLP